MPRGLMQKVEKMQKQMSNINREMESLKYQKKMLEIKIPMTEMNTFNGLLAETC